MKRFSIHRNGAFRPAAILFALVDLVGLSVAVFLGLAYAANSTPTPDKVYGATWVLDTTGTITTEKVYIAYIYWDGCTTDGHDMILTDGDGNLVWQDLEGEEGIAHMFSIQRPVDGLILSTLGSGNVQITVRTVSY